MERDALGIPDCSLEPGQERLAPAARLVVETDEIVEKRVLGPPERLLFAVSCPAAEAFVGPETQGDQNRQKEGGGVNETLDQNAVDGSPPEEHPADALREQGKHVFFDGLIGGFHRERSGSLAENRQEVKKNLLRLTSLLNTCVCGVD